MRKSRKKKRRGAMVLNNWSVRVPLVTMELPPAIKSVKLKGKTVGRPSKVELAVKKMLNDQLSKAPAQAALQQAFLDSSIFGTGVMFIDEQGELTKKSFKQMQKAMRMRK